MTEESLSSERSQPAPVSPRTAPPPTTVAAVDLGSNSFHLVVARLDEGRIHVLDRLRDRVRLAEGLDAKGQLTAEATERALACLTRFGQRVRELPPDAVRAAGTNTLRQAKNSASFLKRAMRCSRSTDIGIQASSFGSTRERFP